MPYSAKSVFNKDLEQILLFSHYLQKKADSAPTPPFHSGRKTAQVDVICRQNSGECLKYTYIIVVNAK